MYIMHIICTWLYFCISSKKLFHIISAGFFFMKSSLLYLSNIYFKKKIIKPLNTSLLIRIENWGFLQCPRFRFRNVCHFKKKRTLWKSNEWMKPLCIKTTIFFFYYHSKLCKRFDNTASDGLCIKKMYTLYTLSLDILNSSYSFSII